MHIRFISYQFCCCCFHVLYRHLIDKSYFKCIQAISVLALLTAKKAEVMELVNILSVVDTLHLFLSKTTKRNINQQLNVLRE